MPTTSLAELSGLLWREREVLDQLLSRLRRGNDDEETEGLLHSISGLEVHRAITGREVAVELGLDGDPSLQDLIASSDSEWASVLAGHRRALRARSDEARTLLRQAPAGTTTDGNIVMLAPTRVRRIQRSLRDFLR